MSYKGEIENQMRRGQWTCQASAWRTGARIPWPFWTGPQGAAGRSAYRAGALLSGVQGSSQTIRSLGGFIFHPEMQRPPQLLDAALAVPDMPSDVRMEGRLGTSWTHIPCGLGLCRGGAGSGPRKGSNSEASG